MLQNVPARKTALLAHGKSREMARPGLSSLQSSEEAESVSPMESRSIAAKLAAVRLLALDCDGVLSDGGLYYGATEPTDDANPVSVRMVRFYAPDGHGQRMLQDAGVKVAWITGNHWPGVKLRAQTLGVHYLATGIEDKGEALRKVSEELGIALGATAYMGDDLNDLGALRLAGLKLAPANAARDVLAIADLVTVARGGEGAVREVADLLVAARKKELDRPLSGP